MRFRTGVITAALLLGSLAELQAADPALRTIARGGQSGVARAERRVVRSQAEWAKLWAAHTSNRRPAPLPRPHGAGAVESEPPAVDFNKEMVLAVFMGQQRSGGYGIAIQQARAEKGKLRVTVAEQKPPPDAITISVITTPFHIVAVPKSTLPVEWETGK